MPRTAIESSTMVSVGYDYDTQTLEIEFVNGHLYQYFDVPPAVHEELLGSESAGQYFNRSVRGHYRYARA